MRIFDYSHLKESISSDILRLSNVIYDLRSKQQIRIVESPNTFEALRKQAIIDSVYGSNAIEGVVTTNKRIKEITDNNFVPLNKPEQEILGYKKALSEIYSGELDFIISEDYIKHLHSLVFENTSDRPGKYKNQNNWISQRDQDGKISIRFVPIDYKQTASSMKQLVLAFCDAYQDEEINKLLLVCCFVVDFLCIHPFLDGNGRVSRLLTTLLLLKCGFDIPKYISIDYKINEYKYNYYDALAKSSDNWHENKNDYSPFIIYMYQIIYSCYKELDNKFEEYSIIKVSKAKQVEHILLNAFVPISKAEIVSKAKGVSAITVTRVIEKLIRDKKIHKIGTYKDARYQRI